MTAIRVKSEIDIFQIKMTEFAERFPAFNPLDGETENQLIWEFFVKVLSMCCNMKELYFSPDHPVRWLLESRDDILSSINVIGNEDVSSPNISGDFVVLEDPWNYMGIVDRYSVDNRHPCLVLHVEARGIVVHRKTFDLSKYATACLGKLHLSGDFFAYVRHDIPSCLFLTELSFDRLLTDDGVLVGLSKAVKEGKLPQLARLIFIGCGALSGRLPMLFSNKWETLNHLEFTRCELNKTDIEYLAGHENRICPNLTSLTLELDEESIRCATAQDVFKKCWPKLTQLNLGRSGVGRSTLDLLHEDDFKALNIPTLTYLKLHRFVNSPKSLNIAVMSAKSPILQVLDLSHSLRISGKLFILTCRTFPSLAHLVVSDCGLNSQDLCSLAQVNIKGRLPELKHLDISHNNELHGQLQYLFSSGEKWQKLLSLRYSFPSLNSLIMSDCGLHSEDLCSLAQAGVEGKLPQLRHLDVSKNNNLSGHLEKLFSFGQQWNQLLSLNVKHWGVISRKDFPMLLTIAQSGCLGSLQKLVISTQRVDGIEKGRWLHLNQLHIMYTPSHFAHILGPMTKAIERGVFPNLARLDISLLSEANLLYSIYRNVPTKVREILTEIRSGPITRDRVVEFLVDYAVRVTTSDNKKREDPEFRSTYRSLIESIEKSQTRDWKTLFLEFYDKMLGTEHSSFDSLVEKVENNMEDFLYEIAKESREAGLRKFTDFKYRLGKRGIRVVLLKG